MLELEASHSHLYPGARGRLLSGRPEDGPVMLTFADGTRVPGTLAGDRLTLAAHKTAAGTGIPEKSWTLRFEGQGFRALSRG
jgi:hypothetical protein